MVRSRIGPWFVATLAVPAVFVGVGLWVQYGGPLHRAQAAEVQRAEEVQRQWRQASEEALITADRGAPVQLQLDAQRLVVGPFRDGPIAPPSTGAEEREAGARFAAGDAAGAMPYFMRARLAGLLSPEGCLLEARALWSQDRRAAHDLLAAATLRLGEARCGNLPFALLAALLEVEWAQAEHVAPDAAVVDGLLRAAQAAPAAAMPTLVEAMVAALPELAQDERLAALRAAAAIAVTHARLPVASGVSAGPNGSVIVANADVATVVAPAGVSRCVEAARAAVAERHDDLTLGYGSSRGGVVLAAGPFGGEWSVRAKGLPSSSLLGYSALACYVLAAATLLLGNLFVWRMTRREHALVRLRADFVDIVSHELRTPLAALSLKAEMLAAGDVPQGRVSHYLHALHADVLRLSDQVERILDFGRLQKGASLRRDVVPARTLLARGVKQGRPALRLVGQQLAVEVPRVLPAIVGDVEVLGRALRNLLENAAKYAPPGSTVAVRAFARGDELVVEVADAGPGVPTADRAGIFQPFVRGSEAPSGTPGSGLGLALVAAAAATHGGRVTVADRPGGGAVFSITLPARHQEVS